MTKTDWNPKAYGRFHDLRLRPALYLMGRIGALPEAARAGTGGIVDLGCGAGAVGPALADRFAGWSVTGVDASPNMLEAARATGAYAALVRADVADWQPDAPPALIFCNAALQWLPDHASLMPRLAAGLAPGGVLAVQMPRQWAAPSHRFLRDIAATMFPGRFAVAQPSPVDSAVSYWELLAPLGRVEAWETDYVQHVTPIGDGHPVRRFTESTVMRPYAEPLTPDELEGFVAAYDAALGAAYPVLADGSALMSFRRVFFVLTV